MNICFPKKIEKGSKIYDYIFHTSQKIMEISDRSSFCKMG